MGVVELDGSGKGWLAPVDKRVRNSSPIADLGGAESGQLVLAEPAGRSPRAGVKVVQVLGDPLAPKSFSLIAIAKFNIPFSFAAETLEEAKLAAQAAAVGQQARRPPRHPDRRDRSRRCPRPRRCDLGRARRARAASTRSSRLPTCRSTSAPAARSTARPVSAVIRSISPTGWCRCCPKC